MSARENSAKANQRRLQGFLITQRAWEQSLKDHQQRLKHAKPAVNVDPPWGADRGPGSLCRGPAPPAARAGPSRPSSSRPSTARSSRPGTATSKAGLQSPCASPRPSAAVAPVLEDIAALEGLTPEQKEVCENMIRLLMSVDTKQSKRVVEQVFMAAEERRLLEGYDGPFPTMLEEGGACRDNDNRGF